MTAAASSSDFDWNDAFLLGYGPIDTVHKEFVDIVGAMLRCPDDEFAQHLDEFAEHAKSHFGAEDAWMTETEFPARECHINEHAEVMKSVEQVRELVAQGNVAVGRSLAQELARWFPGHADYLDSALAQWMCKREFGGKPIVIRRQFESPAPPAL
ncbi:MAG: hemerythrin domain-containing protein [Pigmentiphaga sp.]|uniref:bacteriohemerythrin n=1 Tax=Pigmentiphaga sp. TaxID=1977564 RepID=UPI0029A088BE|nr:hemerythrin domain-containing protein [Pigmentiphaga sp.]MDX3907376.1 hemerythrin domain-containing protein [Pigmentiphaga sp.]